MQQRKCENCSGTGIVQFDAEALKFKRLRKGRTLAFVAQRMKITVSYLCDLEHGRRAWSADLIKRYEAALK